MTPAHPVFVFAKLVKLLRISHTNPNILSYIHIRWKNEARFSFVHRLKYVTLLAETQIHVAWLLKTML